MKNFLKILINSVNECIGPFVIVITLSIVLGLANVLKREQTRSIETDVFLMNHVHQLYLRRDMDKIKEKCKIEKSDSLLNEYKQDSITLEIKKKEADSSLKRLIVIYGK